MATWDNVVYTTQGLNLMAKLQTGAALEITRAIGSDGHISADALPTLTEITAKQTLVLSNAVYKGNGQALLPVTLYNRGLTEGYPLRQIGIYATDPDDGEVLMLVAQTETPDTIPTELASPDFVTNFSFHIALGNAGRINVTYSLTDMATKADYTAFVEQIEGKLGQPNGIATLDGSGKLAQMPTAANVGAVKLRWSTLIDVTSATPNEYNFDDYVTPGDVVSVDNYASAQSIANIPEQVPGKLYVLPLRIDDPGRNDIMQEYHTITGNIHCRSRYYYSGNTWSGWDTSWVTPTLNAPFGCTANEPVRYRKDNHIVTITGWIKNIKLSSTIFTLPVGYRPTMESSFCVPQSQISGANGFARIEIYTSGSVYLWTATYNTGLDSGCALNITFMTD